MFDFAGIVMEQLVVHRVGNKSREEGFIASPAAYPITDGNLEELLLKYFLSAFREKVCYKFHHETDIHLNELYMYVSSIFINPDSFYEQSVNILKHLYETSSHPQVKGGEFYVTYFRDCTFKEQRINAIGIFKTENKENYLKVYDGRGGLTLNADKGINIKKLDKGCIIFNVESVDGFRLAIVDNVNKNGSEAVYWKEEFIRATDVNDEYFQTHNYLDLCRDFAENVYGPVMSADRKDQVMFVNEAIAYFDNNSEFRFDDFVDNVIREPQAAELFRQHKQAYEDNLGVGHADNFEISGPAVKSIKRKFKSLIKLDTAIEIKLKTATGESAESDFIERGFDQQKGMHFYKVYFNAEE